jgi:hypothetical protein
VELAVTEGAVSKPVLSIVPPLLPQVTVVAKVPVPVTVAVHWLVCPDWTAVGVQATVTPETVELLDPLPLQAIIPRRLHEARIRARARKLFPQISYESTTSHTVNEYPDQAYFL